MRWSDIWIWIQHTRYTHRLIGNLYGRIRNQSEKEFFDEPMAAHCQELQMHNICDLSTVRVSARLFGCPTIGSLLRNVRMVNPTKFNLGIALL